MAKRGAEHQLNQLLVRQAFSPDHFLIGGARAVLLYGALAVLEGLDQGMTRADGRARRKGRWGSIKRWSSY